MSAEHVKVSFTIDKESWIPANPILKPTPIAQKSLAFLNSISASNKLRVTYVFIDHLPLLWLLCEKCVIHWNTSQTSCWKGFVIWEHVFKLKYDFEVVHFWFKNSEEPLNFSKVILDNSNNTLLFFTIWQGLLLQLKPVQIRNESPQFPVYFWCMSLPRSWVRPDMEYKNTEY